jgi:ADP-ribosylglycohydrolase
MPTQMLSRERISELYPSGGLTWFEPAPPGHPLADGMPAGSVTDDTEQAVLLGRLLVAGHGTLDPRRFALALSDWEDDMKARGSLDLLGPSTLRAIEAVRAGADPETTGLAGNTNGAAMRITPVGVATPLSGGLEPLVDRVQAASKVTHNTSIALAGAAAVAAAVSFGVAAGPDDGTPADGTPLGGGPAGSGPAGGVSIVEDATEVAIRAARLAATRGHWVAGADVATRIEWATALVRDQPPERAAELIYTQVGTSLATQESVPAAFAVLAAVPDDPWRACLLAASLGGDSDTIAAMTGAIAGACHGPSGFPPEAIATVEAHGLDLGGLADALYDLRTTA